MKHFLIYTNQHKDLNGELTEKIVNYLENKGQKATRMTGEDGAIPSEEDIPTEAYCMLVLGGDGTMLQAARDTKRCRIPLIGVNLGTLGYMTEIEPGCLESALDKLIEGSFQIESRMMLNGHVYHKEDEIKEDWALNDIVISRSGSLQIIKLKVYVNGQFLKEYSADGVIVTTPTGSTGYNLSAGGPIVDPKAQLIMLTPICPHTLNARSIILSPEDIIEIEISAGREGRQEQQVEVSFDGTNVISVGVGDRVKIGKSEKTTEIIKISEVSFLEVLHRKMSDK
ncbi:MAG: NAD(+)/NADH kinase [Lachnospiraceae bacterium]|nr:NAD(+)/NADH kinase [Lachnospiraceae bacterium]